MAARKLGLYRTRPKRDAAFRAETAFPFRWYSSSARWKVESASALRPVRCSSSPRSMSASACMLSASVVSVRSMAWRGTVALAEARPR